MRKRSLVIAISLLAGSAISFANPNPYAGQQTRDIKSLSAKEIDDLKMGRGMGLAKAAELNRYPGPSHALELSDKLALTPAQSEAIKSSFERMSSAAKALGEKILASEQMLDQRFAHQHIDQATLAQMTGQIAVMQGELRRIHLAAHLEMKSILTPQQIETYVTARGYTGTDSGNHSHSQPKH
jgi:Spy/CpxP family protein refolding chaperone